MKKALTVAGYDPSSGAGVTRDADTFFSLGIHAVGVPTCLVIQGPQGVRSVFPIPLDEFRSMLGAAPGNTPVEGLKIGVVCDAPYVDEIRPFLDSQATIPVVVDPIAASKNGTRLNTELGMRRLIERIFPVSHVITPNIDEASIMTGMEIRDVSGMKEAARSLLTLGPRAVVVKGGHLEGDPVDLLYDGNDFFFREKKRLPRQVHGTGCSFSSMLLSCLILGYPLQDAFFAAEDEMDRVLAGSYRIDEGGYFYASGGIENRLDADRFNVLRGMESASKCLVGINAAELVPQSQMDLCYALQEPRGIEDVAGFPGRIGCQDGRVYVEGAAAFGASSPVARMLLLCMGYYPHIRACATVRYDTAIIRRAREKALRVLPLEERASKEGKSGPHGGLPDYDIDATLRGQSRPPDIISRNRDAGISSCRDAGTSQNGDSGREPVMYLFAQNPLKLIEKMETIRS